MRKKTEFGLKAEKREIKKLAKRILYQPKKGASRERRKKFGVLKLLIINKMTEPLFFYGKKRKVEAVMHYRIARRNNNMNMKPSVKQPQPTAPASKAPEQKKPQAPAAPQQKQKVPGK